MTLRFVLLGALCLVAGVGQAGSHGPHSHPLHASSSNPIVHARGTSLVDGRGRSLRLRGVFLEGWLMWNGPLWGAGFTSETRIANRLNKIVGPELFASFREAIYQNFITEEDIEMIANLGFNCVRVPFDHTVLKEANSCGGDAAPGWEYLDRLIDWCGKKGIYSLFEPRKRFGSGFAVKALKEFPQSVRAAYLVPDPEMVEILTCFRGSSSEGLDGTVEKRQGSRPFPKRTGAKEEE